MQRLTQGHDRLACLSADTAAVAQELMAWSDALAAKPTAALRQRSILQLAYAAVHGLKGAAFSHRDALHGQEQQLMACAAQGAAANAFCEP